jgi:thymidine phosphorylase
VPAPEAGYLADIEPFALGQAVVALGGGRRRAEDRVDPAVGILIHKRYGERVEPGEPLAEVLAADKAQAAQVAAEGVAGAFRVEAQAPAPRVLIKHLVTSEGRWPWNGAETWDAAGTGRR